MIETGKYNRLIAHRKSDHGIYLRDGEGNEVLLPNASVPETLKVDDEVEVFVYTDSEDRPIATHLHPYTRTIICIPESRAG
jgi:predicted RNA-binding protein (virulence factor B family)